MGRIYLVGIYFYYAGILIASLFNKKAKSWINGRKNIFRKLSKAGLKNSENIWVHCSSLGEFEQGRPIIEKIKQQSPNKKIILTFFSPSGFEVRKNYQGADYICYLPLDTPGNAKHFIELVNPGMAIFVKYEFWYYFLKQLNKSKIPVYLISAIFRENQVFFKWYGKWYRNMLFFFDHIFVQNKESKELISKINTKAGGGLKNITISGDTRFDRVHDIAMHKKDIPLINTFKQGLPLLVAGSTWPKDESLLASFMNSGRFDVKLVIAPHEIDKTHIESVKKQISVDVVKFSGANEKNCASARVMIIDNIGMLSSLYQYGEIAYIGGGLGKGIHNTLEAAIFGMPVIFGPNYKRFREAVDLIDSGGAFTFHQYGELKNILSQLLTDAKMLENTGKKALNYTKSNIGATSIIMQGIFKS